MNHEKKKGFGLGISLIAIMFNCMYCISNHDDDWQEKYMLLEL